MKLRCTKVRQRELVRHKLLRLRLDFFKEMVKCL